MAAMVGVEGYLVDGEFVPVGEMASASPVEGTNAGTEGGQAAGMTGGVDGRHTEGTVGDKTTEMPAEVEATPAGVFQAQVPEPAAGPSPREKTDAGMMESDILVEAEAAAQERRAASRAVREEDAGEAQEDPAGQGAQGIGAEAAPTPPPPAKTGMPKQYVTCRRRGGGDEGVGTWLCHRRRSLAFVRQVVVTAAQPSERRRRRQVTQWDDGDEGGAGGGSEGDGNGQKMGGKGGVSWFGVRPGGQGGRGGGGGGGRGGGREAGRNGRGWWMGVLLERRGRERVGVATS